MLLMVSRPHQIPLHTLKIFMRKRILMTVVILTSITFRSVEAQKIGTIIDSLYSEFSKAKTDTLKTLILSELSYRYYAIPDSSFSIARKGLSMANAIDYKRGIAANQFSLGNSYSMIGDYVHAYKHISQALELQRIYGAPYELARSYLILGFVSNDQLGYEKSTGYFKKALYFYEQAKNSQDIVLVLNNLGVVYSSAKKYDSALLFLNRALMLTKKNRSTEFEAVILQSIGEVFLATQEYSKAEPYFINSIVLNKNFDKRIQAINYLDLALIYKTTYLTDKAIQNAKQSLEFAREAADLTQVERASLVLHELFLLQHDYQKALQYLKESALAHDSIYSIEKNAMLQRLTTNFEMREKESQIKILQQESSLQQIGMQLQKDNLKRQQFILIGLMVVLVLLAILFTWYRMINRIKRELEIERIRNSISKDLHDDIGSTLSSIRIISKMGAQNAFNESESRNFLLIENNSSKMLSTMADIVWSINPNNDTMERIVLHMREFAAEILEPQNINYIFTIEDKLNSLKVGVTVRKNIFLIFKEAINNAMKYSTCSDIAIKIRVQGGILSLQVQDNGTGFDSQKVKFGNGINNMKERAELLNGRIEIRSEISKGTNILVSVPIT